MEDLTRLGHRLAAMAQNGLHYDNDPYAVDRWTSLLKVAAALLAGDVGGAATADAESLAVALAQQEGHATPKVDVRGVCTDRSGRMLLVREVADGLWCLPGGWAEPALTPSASVVKEVAEEAGLAVRVERVLGVLDRALAPGVPPHAYPIYKLFFACTVIGPVRRGTTMDEVETDAVGWFDLDDLPPMSAGRTHPDQLARIRPLLADPTLPAVFD
ncbi:MAG TPA: NUDIX hydrolase N-terminal domain-containing protein [Euzebya sp.]|nr:NUDIX hydrolase N-terminal domain-containing protein [Euzebya sp.]